MPPPGQGEPGETTLPLPVSPPPPPAYAHPPSPQYGGQSDGRMPPRRRKRRAVSLWILGVVVVIVAALWTSALGFVSPGWFVRKVFDPRGVQLGVQQVLRDSYHVDGVESVTCPPDEPVRSAVTFACAVRVSGQTRTVTITASDDSGTYQVSRPR